ncbi:type VII secretion-associated serine protease mycosin [Allocatelliglobosispora scoriae]|nr:type VII secretion-associated serine protease mycosin [Allocatelliglobosispora scoriae]
MVLRGRLLAAVALAAAAGLPGAAAAAAPTVNCTTPSQQLSREIPWTHKRLAPSRVWPLTRGQGVTVAVIDTGVDALVPQLFGKVLQGADIINGGGNANTDCYGHGTFVAGIIAAEPITGSGVSGIAPGVKILPIRQATGPNDGSSSTLANGIRAAVTGGASVVNISATAFFPSDDLRDAVRFAAERDVVLVAAAANEAQTGNPIAYPAAYPQVIAVGAIGQDGQRSEFSEVGSYLDLVAPGVDVVSLSRGGTGHLLDSGTSYATPFVTATAALVRAYHPKLTARQVMRRLELTADHPGAALPDPRVGWGVVNPYAAVTAVLAEEGGQPAKAVAGAPVEVALPVAADTSAKTAALEFTIAVATVTAVIALVAYLVPHGIRRRWRSVDEDPAEPPTKPGRGR